MSDTVIKTNQLTKKYGKQTVVNKVNLNVKKGRIYGLLGRNGAGKTTIMKMILGLTTTTSGNVEVFGKNIDGNEKRIYSRIGAIIETPGFYPNLTGTENLEIFAKLRGTASPNAVKHALEVVGLSCISVIIARNEAILGLSLPQNNVPLAFLSICVWGIASTLLAKIKLSTRK